MSKDKPKEIAEIWDSVRDAEAGDAEYLEASPDFKAKLGAAAAEARQGRSTGIAGLEKFEEAVAKDAGVTLAQSGVDAARVAGAQQPTVFDEQSRALRAEAAAGAEKDAKLTAKGTGAQKEEGKVAGKAKALKDAAGAASKVESDETNSPSFPSAARPLAAEVPGSTPEKQANPKKSGAKKSAAKKAGK